MAQTLRKSNSSSYFGYPLAMRSHWQAPNALLGAEVLSALPKWLQQALEDNNAQAVALSEGLSNDNYRLCCSQGDWVLRVNRQQSVWCDRQQELANWRCAAKAGLAPGLIWHSDDNTFYLSQFIIQAKPWSALMGPQAQNNSQDLFMAEHKHLACSSLLDENKPIGLLMDLLRPLSQLPVPDVALTPRVQWQDYFTRLTAITVDTRHVPTSAWQQAFEQLSALSVQIELWLTQLESCLVANQYCHRDLNPSNLLLVGDRLQCIDFEYATASHPLFELASVIATHQLTPFQVSSLTQQYLAFNPNVNQSGLEAMPAAMNCYWLCCAAWALLMAAERFYSVPPAFTTKKVTTNSSQSLQTYLTYFKEYQQLITI
ncbi:phosphotransferase [Shewanella sp.]|uniref:phosphotransferase n=1 Tax=Shewanella sp. TaxID=50422 RepID=UPI0040548689